jgi:hypothetical protein
MSSSLRHAQWPNGSTYLMLILLPQLTPCNGKDAASESRVDEQVAMLRQVGGHSGAECRLLGGLVARECVQMVDALLRALDEFVEVIWRPHYQGDEIASQTTAIAGINTAVLC